MIRALIVHGGALVLCPVVFALGFASHNTLAMMTTAMLGSELTWVSDGQLHIWEPVRFGLVVTWAPLGAWLAATLDSAIRWQWPRPGLWLLAHVLPTLVVALSLGLHFWSTSMVASWDTADLIPMIDPSRIRIARWGLFLVVFFSLAQALFIGSIAAIARFSSSEARRSEPDSVSPGEPTAP